MLCAMLAIIDSCYDSSDYNVHLIRLMYFLSTGCCQDVKMPDEMCETPLEKALHSFVRLKSLISAELENKARYLEIFMKEQVCLL